MISTEGRKHRDSAEKPDKAESKQLSHNCHITVRGKAYLVQEQTAEVGEEREGSARANNQKKKEETKKGMDQESDSRKRDLSFAQSSTPKRTEVTNARRPLDRMMDNNEYQQGPSLNQALFQDVSSHLSTNVGDETNDTQSLGASFEGSPKADPEQGAIASAIVERIDRLAKSTQHGF